MHEQGQKDDASLARAAQQGDEGAFEALLSRHERRVFAFLAQMTGDRSHAEDLSQIVWVTVHRQFHCYDPARPFVAWVLTITRRTAISAWRRQRREMADELLDHHWVDRRHPAEPYFRRDDEETIWTWIGEHLSPEQRDALWLMYKEDLGVRDIARTLNCSVVRVKVMLHRARKKLLKAMDGQSLPGAVEAMGTAG